MKPALPPLLPAGLLGAAALVLAACDDPFAVKPQLDVATDTLAVYAINNSAGSYYSGVEVVTIDQDGEIGPEVVPILFESGGGARDFDVALDITPEGKAIVYPVRLLVPGSATRPVGLLATDSTFDEVRSAPRGEYSSDAPVVLGEGEVVIIESPSQSCAFSVNSKGSNYYAKLVVDSIRTEPVERIFVRVTSDPNCGFRSFEPGLPEN